MPSVKLISAFIGTCVLMNIALTSLSSPEGTVAAFALTALFGWLCYSSVKKEIHSNIDPIYLSKEVQLIVRTDAVKNKIIDQTDKEELTTFCLKYLKAEKSGLLLIIKTSSLTNGEYLSFDKFNKTGSNTHITLNPKDLPAIFKKAYLLT